MKNILKKSVILLIACLCVAYPVYVLIFSNGFLHWQCMEVSNVQKLILELAIWIAICLMGIKTKNVAWIVIVTLLFSYLHLMLLPILFAIGYGYFTWLIGKFTSSLLFRSNHEDDFLIHYFWGIIVLTVMYAVLSLVKVGSIRNLRIVDLVLALLLSLWYLRKYGICVQKIQSSLRVTGNIYLKLTGIIAFFMIAIGRANISLDYDSIWYGLRSNFNLDSATGIYENLKLVGCVYTYPKGYETYVLPLSNSKSYGFIYAENIFFGAIILLVAYKICRLFLKKEKALWAALLLSAVSGVMNMTITAKTDILTLLVQLITIYFAILYVKHKKALYFGMIFATYIYTQTLKTTSIIFSTSILLALFFVMLVYRIKIKIDRKSALLVGVSIIDLLLMWYRTYIMTGIPATSVWGKFFRLLGFTDRYPYASGQISQFREGNLFTQEILTATMQRLKEFFFAPQSEEMDHVIIAWGTTLCTFLLLVTLIGFLVNWKYALKNLRNNAEGCLLGILFAGELAGAVMSLWILSKPDGNYFVLYYSTTVIISVIFIEKYLVERKKVQEKFVWGITCVFLPVNMIFTGAVSWAWTSSFTPIEWTNCGYYEHREEFKQTMYNSGCVEIYNILASNPTNRVFAFDEHPKIERIPCIVESDLDVGYWGNVELTANAENYEKYVEYAKYDYILVNKSYVEQDGTSYNNICYLFDCGIISDALQEGNYMLLTIQKPDNNMDIAVLKTQFLKMYMD